jgi:nitrate reductase molybdenum cofactor assembly chaperone
MSTPTEKQRALALIAFLLDYPDRAWRDARAEAESAIDGLSDKAAARTMRAFLAHADKVGATRFEQSYVDEFDFGKTTGLYLTARGYNDDNQKRMGLLAYSAYFAESGFEPQGETPDFLPGLLELAAATDSAQADRILRGSRDDMKLLRDELAERGLGEYADLVGLALSMAGKPDKEAAA